MHRFFNELFDYNFYCNRKLIEACNLMEKVPDRSVTLFSHILDAHHIWNARMSNRTPEYAVWQLQDLRDWANIHYENQRNSFDIITNADDLGKRVEYENSQGRRYTNNLQDMLFHIINHSTHHRAQIAVDFRQNGLEPIPMDFTLYKR
ncbi:MAG: DinB family protein [Sediminicola sp.]|tara:strand:- start:23908 stop:24351 length:444 start_codon:yes stop_codon:yes gene_type:complete